MSVEPGYGRAKIGLATIALLIATGVLVQGDSIPVAGQATGSTSRGGCGGSGGDSPDICRTNSDCGPDLVCVQGDCVAAPEPEPEPEPEPSCDTNSDCGQGMVCISGNCLNATTCTATSECGLSQMCHDGECISDANRACYIDMENLAPVVESANPASQLSFQWEETTTVVTSSRKTELQNHYNEMYWYFRDHFDYGAISSPLRIRAFDSTESFDACMTFLGKDGATNAFYSTGLDRVFVNQSHLSSWGSTRRVLLHEASHFIFNQEISGGAIIINEGLADAFAYLALRINSSGTRAIISPNSQRRQRLRALKASDELYGLDAFFQISNASWQANGTVTYAQSWGLVHFMLQTDPQLLRAIVANLKQHPSIRQSYQQVIELNYSGGSNAFDAFEADWLTWIDGNHSGVLFSHP